MSACCPAQECTWPRGMPPQPTGGICSSHPICLGGASQVMSALAQQIDDVSRLQAQLFGRAPLELSALMEASRRAHGSYASTDGDGEEEDEDEEDEEEEEGGGEEGESGGGRLGGEGRRGGEGRVKSPRGPATQIIPPSPAAKRISIYSDGGEAVGVYEGFNAGGGGGGGGGETSGMATLASVDEGGGSGEAAATSAEAPADSSHSLGGGGGGTEEARADAHSSSGEASRPAAVASGDFLGGEIGEDDGEEDDEEDDTEEDEEEAMEEARGAMAAALSDELVRRMEAISALKERLEATLRQDDYGAAADSAPPLVARRPSLTAKRASLRYSTAGVAIGAYEGFSPGGAVS